jgi:hypothetical protein
VVLTATAILRVIGQYALAFQTITEVLPTANQNVFNLQNVQPTRLAFNRDVLILASANLVDLGHPAKFETTLRYVLVLRTTLEILS